MRKIIISFKTAWLFTCGITNIISDNTSLSNAMIKPNRNLPEIFLKIFQIAVIFYCNLCLFRNIWGQGAGISIGLYGFGCEKRIEGRRATPGLTDSRAPPDHRPKLTIHWPPLLPTALFYPFFILYQILWTILKSK